MMIERVSFRRLAGVFIAITTLMLAGCTTKDHYVIASTGTVIGVEIAQNPANQTPQAKLGYNRAELAIVPSNRTTCVVEDDNSAVICGSAKGNAKDVPDVLMELRYSGIFDFGSTSGIYQRLAVGKDAVSQPGAGIMFAKDSSGKITPQAVETLAEANLFQTISRAEYDALVKEKREELSQRRDKIHVILGKVQKAGDPTAIDQTKLDKLITNAKLDRTRPLVEVLGRLSKVDDLKEFLELPGKQFVDRLHDAQPD